MVCKVCNIDKLKEPIIRGDVTRFVNESGHVWNGKVCPQCYRVYNRERMRRKRSEKKLDDALKI